MQSRLAIILLAMGLWTASAGADLLVIDAVPGVGTPIQDTDHNLIDITTDLILNQGAFTPLFGQDYTASLNYAGVVGAIAFDQDAAGTTLTMTFATGFSIVFNGTDRADLQRQFEDFIKDGGAQEYARLLKLINELSTLGVTDGNPNATTALMHRGAFYRYGFLMPGSSQGRLERPSLDRWESRRDDPTSGGWVIGYRPQYTHVRADDGHGNMAGFDFTAGRPVNDNTGISIGFSAHYFNYEGSRVLHATAEVAMPLAVIVPTEDRRVLWELTPYAQMSAGASADLLSGAILPGVGVVSGFHFESGDWLISIANQIGHSDSLEVELDDGEFDPEISQQLWSNAIRGTTALSENSWCFLGLGYHDFLNEAAVGSWVSPEVGFQWANGLQSLSLRYRADIANDYKAHNISIGFSEGF